MAAGSNIRTFFDNKWHDGNPAVMCAADHAMWLGTLVFDGARSHNGAVPDLQKHCQRINESATALGLKPTMTADDMTKLANEGLKHYETSSSVYVRPMYWSTGNAATSVILPDPESTAFCLCLEELPMAPASASARLMLSSFVRPMLSMATVNAKAACLYPNNARMFREAIENGFDNALVLDALGNVAETASSNIFMCKDGVVKTPVPNGTFLNGITRQRVLSLLTEDGHSVVECTLSHSDFLQADEVFMTGNMTKITPVTKIDDVEFEAGPIGKRARELYWDWAGFNPA